MRGSDSCGSDGRPAVSADRHNMPQVGDLLIRKVHRKWRHDSVHARAGAEVQKLLVDHGGVLTREVGRVRAADAGRAVADRAALCQGRPTSDRLGFASVVGVRTASERRGPTCPP